MAVRNVLIAEPRAKHASRRTQHASPRYSSITMFPPASRLALAPGVTRQVASYSSMMRGPVFGARRSLRRSTGVSIQPCSVPK